MKITGIQKRVIEVELSPEQYKYHFLKMIEDKFNWKRGYFISGGMVKIGIKHHYHAGTIEEIKDIRIASEMDIHVEKVYNSVYEG